MIQRLPFKELHHDERLAIVQVEVVDCADVRMIQRGGCVCFEPKPTSEIHIARNALRYELHRHESSQLQVLGLVHDAHAACADLLEDLIVRNTLPDHVDWILIQRSGRHQLWQARWEENQNPLLTKEGWRTRASPIGRSIKTRSASPIGRSIKTRSASPTGRSIKRWRAGVVAHTIIFARATTPAALSVEASPYRGLAFRGAASPPL